MCSLISIMSAKLVLLNKTLSIQSDASKISEQQINSVWLCSMCSPTYERYVLHQALEVLRMKIGDSHFGRSKGRELSEGQSAEAKPISSTHLTGID